MDLLDLPYDLLLEIAAYLITPEDSTKLHSHQRSLCALSYPLTSSDCAGMGPVSL